MPEKVGDCIEHTVQEIGDALNSGFIGPQHPLQPAIAGGPFYGPRLPDISVKCDKDEGKDTNDGSHLHSQADSNILGGFT